MQREDDPDKFQRHVGDVVMLRLGNAMYEGWNEHQQCFYGQVFVNVGEVLTVIDVKRLNGKDVVRVASADGFLWADATSLITLVKSR